MGDLTFMEYDALSPKEIVNLLASEKRAIFGTGDADTSLRKKARVLHPRLSRKLKRLYLVIKRSNLEL
jgi:hypothetical protein